MDTAHQKKYWGYPETQIKIAVIDEPFLRIYNSYKQFQNLCEEEPELESINREICNKTLEEYLEPLEIDDPYSEQFQYITGLTPEDFPMFETDKFLSYAYNMVLLNQRFDESLAVLYIRFGFPWKVIPYTVSNQNLEAYFPDISNSTRDLIYEKLVYEKELYDTASKLLDNHIAAIGNEIFLPILTLLKETNRRVFDECKLKERVLGEQQVIIQLS